VGVVLDAELVRDRQQERVRGLDRGVLGELLDEHIGLRRVRTPEDRFGLRVEVADLVRLLAAAAEIRPVAVVDQREDAATDRYARLALVPGGFPRLAEQPDLLGLELVANDPSADVQLRKEED
jgi:hypothetical protein